MYENLTCCFTGHRHILKSDYPSIKTATTREIIRLINNGVKFFGVGGAIGFDTMVASIIIKLRELYPHIKLILVLPCKNQDQYWCEKSKETYNTIKTAADKIVYISETYTKNCMANRNKHLVNNSKYCICYLKQNYGGTAFTVNYAKRKGLYIYNVAKNDK